MHSSAVDRYDDRSVLSPSRSAASDGCVYSGLITGITAG